MSISGMTGFARAEGEHGALRWVWELKSVNGRGLDLKLRLPAGFETLEPAARAAAGKRFKRGSLQAALSFARAATQAPAVKIDHALVETLLQAGEKYVGRIEKPRWDGLLGVRGVLTSEDAAEMDEKERAAFEAALTTGFETAIEGLDAARRNEGRMLANVLGQLAARLDEGVTAARASPGTGPAAALERVRVRLAALGSEIQADPQRLAQEAAMIATKADVQEELDRLTAHAAELRTLLTSAEAVGRKLDFLGQELTRESNTLCAKSADLELTRIGLDLKAVVDQIKEQAANVE